MLDDIFSSLLGILSGPTAFLSFKPLSNLDTVSILGGFMEKILSVDNLSMIQVE